MNRVLLTLFFLTSISAYSFSQKELPAVQVLTKDIKTNLRGLSVVNNKVVWVSGSNGTVGITTDGGKSWKWMSVTGFEHKDFRDIEAFDQTTAVIMAIDTPAYVLRTVDAGRTWKVVYENKKPGMFLDAMEFWNEQSGIVIGDPVNGKFFVLRTFDGGNKWQEVPDTYKPKADSGEALFAASGTNVRALDRDEAVFVSGGSKSRIFIRNEPSDLPLLQGSSSTGANSIAVGDHNKLNGGMLLTVVGGDFTHDTLSTYNCFYSNDRGKTWKRPQIPPHGYRSCVEYISKKELLTCGLTGVDYSTDGGQTWQLISTESYNTCRMAKEGSAVYLAGAKGKIAKLVFGRDK